MTHAPGQRARVAILISGRGSNMLALLDAMAAGAAPGEPVLVASNRPHAPGLALARERGAPIAALDHKTFGSREAFDAAMHDTLVQAGAEWVCLAGFMRILTPTFIKAWSGRLINIHPSLLPKHPGLHTHKRALAAGDAVHGATVHFVTQDVDAGPIIGQAQTPIRPDDTEDTLAARVLALEHDLYPRCLAKVLANAKAEREGGMGENGAPPPTAG